MIAEVEVKHVTNAIDKIFYLQRDSKSVLSYHLATKKIFRVKVDIEKNFPSNY
jgi:hypothetical protein